jgi:hypothetical protein
MYNQQLVDKLVEQFGKEEIAKFAEIVSVMYDIKYNACKDSDGLCEFDYERDWWLETSVTLKKE